MKRDESVYLRHILDAIIKAEEYLQGLDENSFNGNSLVQDGVIRQRRCAISMACGTNRTKGVLIGTTQLRASEDLGQGGTALGEF